MTSKSQEYQKAYSLRNKDRIREVKRLYRQKRSKLLKDTWRRGFIKQKYGLTAEGFAAMVEAQAGLCSICTEPMKPGSGTHIDHCHKTGKVRSLLCPNCNQGIGRFLDDPTRLESAADYLRGHSETHIR